MKKRIITTAAFVACLALCAAVCLQNEPAVETPAPSKPPAVIAAQPEVPKTPEIEEIIMPEEEKADVPQPESIEETVTIPESTPIQISPVSGVQAPPQMECHTAARTGTCASIT